MQNFRDNRLTLEKFVYQKGTNVALYNAEHSEPYQQLQKDLQASFMSQVKSIAKDQAKLDTLMLFTKAANLDLINQVTIMLASSSVGIDVDMKAYLYWAGTQGGQAALDKLNISGIFGLKNQALIDYFDNYSNLLITSVDDTTKKWIADVIQRGKDNLLNPFEIADLLVESGEDMSKDRAEKIVLTETAKAMTVVEIEAARRYNIVSKVWRTSLDERVCPICQPLDGKHIDLLGMFDSQTAGPPAHVRCRCYLELVTPEAWQPPQNPWLGE